MWRTWFGEVEEKNGKYIVKKADDFIKAFRNSENLEPLPFNFRNSRYWIKYCRK